MHTLSKALFSALLPTFFVLLKAGIAFAEELPPFYQQFSRPLKESAELDYAVIDVNSEARLVKAGQKLSFVRGDILSVRRIAMKGPPLKVDEVNVVGYARHRSETPRDDRGEHIDTSKVLDSGAWAVDKEGRTFAVIVASGKTLHGVVYLERILPELRYVDVLVNEGVRVMREGETLAVRASDQFKVQSVVTNLEHLDDVKVQIVAAKSSPGDGLAVGKHEHFEILFSHRAFVFGRIPLVVEKL